MRLKSLSTNSVECGLKLYKHGPWFLRVCNTGLLKTQWEKEKLLYLFGELSAIFFFKYEIVLCKLFQFGRV